MKTKKIPFAKSPLPLLTRSRLRSNCQVSLISNYIYFPNFPTKRSFSVHFYLSLSLLLPHCVSFPSLLPHNLFPLSLSKDAFLVFLSHSFSPFRLLCHYHSFSSFFFRFFYFLSLSYFGEWLTA